MHMNICFATDDNFVKPTAVAMMTILLSNRSDDFTFYIITQGITEQNKDILKSTAKKYSQKSSVEFCVLTDETVNTFSSTLKKEDHVSLATYLRIFIPSLLPKNVDKVLYLDGDIICVDSIKELYETDLADFSMAAAHDSRTADPESFSRLGYPIENGYAAAGVLLINVDWWRKNDVQNKTLAFVTEHKDICKWHDQDALNKILNGTIKFCHIKYNTYETIFYGEINYPTSLSKEVQEAQQNPVFIHYCSGRKPWTKETHCPFSSTWRNLYKKLFGKNCRIVYRYKGKLRFMWSIKRIVHMLGIKKYHEFSTQNDFAELRTKIENKLLRE